MLLFSTGTGQSVVFSNVKGVWVSAVPISFENLPPKDSEIYWKVFTKGLKHKENMVFMIKQGLLNYLDLRVLFSIIYSNPVF